LSLYSIRLVSYHSVLIRVARQGSTQVFRPVKQMSISSSILCCSQSHWRSFSPHWHPALNGYLIGPWSVTP
jgi:hypothetical protein